MLGSENWEDNFDTAAFSEKVHCSHMGSAYAVMTHTRINFSVSPRSEIGGRDGKSDKSGISHGKGEGHVVHAGVNCVCNVYDSSHSCGCMVNDSFARAAF